MTSWQSQLNRSQQLCALLLVLLLLWFHTHHLLKPLTPHPSPEPSLPSPSPPSLEPLLASEESPLLAPSSSSLTPLPLLAATSPAPAPKPSTALVPSTDPPGVPRANPQPPPWGASNRPVAGAAPGFAPLAWVPRPDRYLLPLCFRGQVSNIVRCLRNSVLAAGLLNRTLLVPRSIAYQKDPSRVWDLNLLWDLRKSEECLGEGTLVTVDEYVARRGESTLRVELINCWGGPRGVCHERDDGLSHSCPGRKGSRSRGKGRGGGGSDRATLAALGVGAAAAPREILPVPEYWARETPNVSIGDGTAAVAACLPRSPGLPEFLAAFRSEARVLSLGDLVLPDVPRIAAAAAGFRPSEGSAEVPATLPITAQQTAALSGKSTGGGRGEASLAAFFQGDHPFAGQPGKCTSRLAIHPAARFLAASQAMARSLSEGDRFACVHWRRGDFAAFCGRDRELKGHCTYGAPQAASCLAAALGFGEGGGGRATPGNILRVFLATNAGQTEVDQLKWAVGAVSSGEVLVLQISDSPAASEALEGAKAGLSQSQRRFVDVIADKLVCAQADVFVGSTFSTFSEDISWIRHGLGKETGQDSTVCGGGKEWTSKESRAFAKRFLKNAPVSRHR